MEQRFQILSLDGGGIRGLFSAAILAAVEEDLRIRLADCFDLIAGTSTGGIIAIALGLGLSPAQIVEFYLKHGSAVFSNQMRLGALRRLLRAKYSSTALEGALRATFGDRLLGDSTKRLVIPSFSLGDDDVYVFRTPHAQRLRRDFRVPAWKVALATAAAPTYFPACRAVDNLRLVDGGIWANNPALVALAESVGTLSVSLESIRMLSVGTLRGVARHSAMLDYGGILHWSINASAILMRSASTGVTNQAEFLLGKERFLRIDPMIPARDVVLDSLSSTNGLIQRARHHSRHMVPQVELMFAGHAAAPYVPLYPTPGVSGS